MEQITYNDFLNVETTLHFCISSLVVMYNLSHISRFDLLEFARIFFKKSGHNRVGLLIFFSYNIFASFYQDYSGHKNELSGKLSGEEIQKREGDICKHIADSRCCITETNNIVKQVYSNRKREI